MIEVEKDQMQNNIVASYKSLILHHFDSQTDELFFSGVKVNGKNEGYCEVLTQNYFYKGHYKDNLRNGQGVIQIKGDFKESLGVEGIRGLKGHSAVVINQGIIFKDLA